jgi:hypothetical protein
LERFRKKIDSPLAWSDTKWRKTCENLENLAAEVPEISTPQASSPVADY